ncbi:hypothetical protein JKP88DRAFT_347850 [Tribonema minus]|uniref:ribonuclease P n=1 Tax=Tribonema minus TaxID=303371 RepID=A0A835ZAC6_9STRA|nr:hypothetical protein JKP88DRAFT_347850 [Tribonema minus]
MMVAEESSSAGMVDVQQYLLTAEADPKEEWRVLHRGLVATLKAADGDGAVALYMAVRKRGYTVPRGIYNGVINLCGNSSRVAVGLQIFEHMREAGHLPQENSYAFLVRERASRGAFAEGLQLVTDMVAQGLAPRLRTYAPLLQGLCAVPDMTMAWRVWAHMKGQGVVATPDLYVTMLRGASLSGDLWSMVATGEVDALLAELSYEVFELDGDLIEQLQQAFNAGLQEPVASMVSVESGGKGSCPACTSHLKAIGLTPREREKVRRALRVMATEKFPANGSAKASSAGGNGDSGSGSSSSSAAAADTLLNFAQWLRERAKFTAVVDAPNVAYHNQNFPGGCFQMAQVDAVVQKLEARGERVLVVCPERYLRAIIPNSTRFARLQRKRTVLSPQALAIIRSWEEKGILYRQVRYQLVLCCSYVPTLAGRCANTDNDDWYWMYLTVAFDNVAAPVTVVSNDLMRDHRLALLEPTPFVRWKRTQQMRYYFPRVALEGSTESLEVDLFDPPPFTRDIQVYISADVLKDWTKSQ